MSLEDMKTGKNVKGDEIRKKYQTAKIYSFPYPPEWRGKAG